MYLLIIKKSTLTHLRPATVASEVTKGQGGLIKGIHYKNPQFEARRLKFCMYVLIIKKSTLSHLRPATVASEVTKGQGG